MNVLTILGSPLGRAWVAFIAATAMVTLALDQWLRSAETGQKRRTRKQKRKPKDKTEPW